MRRGRRRTLARITAAVAAAAYDLTFHAVEELAEDELDILDLEAALLSGAIVNEQADDPRGPRCTVHGTAADGETPLAVVGRFTETNRLLIITVYEVTDEG